MFQFYPSHCAIQHRLSDLQPDRCRHIRIVRELHTVAEAAALQLLLQQGLGQGLHRSDGFFVGCDVCIRPIARPLIRARSATDQAPEDGCTGECQHGFIASSADGTTFDLTGSGTVTTLPVVTGTIPQVCFEGGGSANPIVNTRAPEAAAKAVPKASRTTTGAACSIIDLMNADGSVTALLGFDGGGRRVERWRS
jgi:hypothetical protein